MLSLFSSKILHISFLIFSDITKGYKKAPLTTEENITIQDKTIATKLELDDRIDVTAEKQAFVTLKDHKPNFRNNPTCRLINPAKPEIGKISKQILEKIKTDVKTATKLNQWKNTDEVITWFNNVEGKQNNAFICFDVCEFYRSIMEELLDKALDFAKNYTTIIKQDSQIIMQTKQSLLYNDQTAWCKKNSNFDVTMGSFDGVETCELVGLYMLSQLES